MVIDDGLQYRACAQVAHIEKYDEKKKLRGALTMNITKTKKKNHSIQINRHISLGCQFEDKILYKNIHSHFFFIRFILLRAQQQKFGNSTQYFMSQTRAVRIKYY